MFTLLDLAKHIGGECPAEYEQVEIKGLSSIASATAQDITFISDLKYMGQLRESSAGAVVLKDTQQLHTDMPYVIHPNPYLAYAKLSQLFISENVTHGVAPTAVIHETAQVGADVIIEDHVSIGAYTVIGNGVLIKSGVRINEYVSIGDDCIIGNNVSLCKDTQIGQRTTLHAGAVIGSDGFGFANEQGRWVKIHQLGKVIIGSDVEIGANTCVDRGALDDTVIEDGVIIDNLVQIAHNVLIGENTAIAATSAIAGSAVIGKNCTLGGSSKVVGHISIADGTHIAANTLVTHSIKTAGAYASGVPIDDIRSWRKNAVRFKQLDQLAKRIKKLENDKD